MTEQKRAAVEYTQEELETMVKAVLNGATIGDVCNVSQDMLESLYSLGYNLYTSGNYKDAETVFSGLCLYDHNDPRFWMGLAGSRQANGKYQEAVDAYGLCSAMGGARQPRAPASGRNVLPQNGGSGKGPRRVRCSALHG